MSDEGRTRRKQLRNALITYLPGGARPRAASGMPFAAFLLVQLLLLCNIVAAPAAAQTPAAGQVQVQISLPATGATVTGAEVLVVLATTGAVALDGAQSTEWNQSG